MASLSARLLDREPTDGVWVYFASSAVAELPATQPFDFVVLDMEHTEATAETVIAMLRAVDALDALFVGPPDRSAALGVLGEYDHPDFEDALARIRDAAADAGVPVGTLVTSAAGLAHWVDRGMDFIVAGLGAEFFAAGAEAAGEAYESAVES